MFSLDGQQVSFSFLEFQALCNQANSNKGFFSSSVRTLLNLLKNNPHVSDQEIIAEIKKVPQDKRAKYKDAIKYLVFTRIAHFDELVTLNPQQSAQFYGQPSFLEYWQYLASNDPVYTDLLYGLSASRKLNHYKIDPSQQSQLQIIDYFNNASNIGNGLAFGRNWYGGGLLNATPATVIASIRKGSPDPAERNKVSSDARDIFLDQLLNSRYSPLISFSDPANKLKSSQLNSYTRLRANNPRVSSRKIEKHAAMEARMIKSIRRACKAGIAMVASNPAYINSGAKIHFVLDGMGDLGKAAYKQATYDPSVRPDKNDKYVAITTSELCFCCRYWNDTEHPLKNIVQFYVNGVRVLAPWDADYVISKDATGQELRSNQEAWLRYRYAQALIDGHKTFPKYRNS